jgi:thiosulfate dehydrogenase
MSRTSLALVCFVAGLLTVPLAIYIYIAYGRPPVATADLPFPFEERLVKIPLHVRIHREMPASSPIPPSDDNLNAGAGIYDDKCATCHGSADEDSGIGKAMFPTAPQLWKKRKAVQWE